MDTEKARKLASSAKDRLAKVAIDKKHLNLQLFCINVGKDYILPPSLTLS